MTHDLELLMIKELLYETVDSVVDGGWHENYGEKDLSVRDSTIEQLRYNQAEGLHIALVGSSPIDIRIS